MAKRRAYCSDRMCGGSDCSTCYGEGDDGEGCEVCGAEYAEDCGCSDDDDDVDDDGSDDPAIDDAIDSARDLAAFYEDDLPY